MLYLPKTYLNVYSRQYKGNIKFADDWIRTSEATDVPTEPQPLPNQAPVFVCKYKIELKSHFAFCFSPDSQRIKTYLAKMEHEGLARVKMFVVITVAYLIFWGPLFLVTLFSYGDYKTETPSTSHEVTLHVAFVHAFVNPTLFLVNLLHFYFLSNSVSN